MNRKIAFSLLSIVMAVGMTAGATFAFFTDTATSTGNTLSSGTLEVSITDQNTDSAFADETLISNWAPGEETLVNFDVKNTGTLPVHLRGFAAGTWGSSELDGQNMVKVTKVERWNGSAWETLSSNPAGLTGYFYYTNNGADGGTYFEVAPDARAQFQLTVELDSTAGNDFQDQTFNSSIQVEAKQVEAAW